MPDEKQTQRLIDAAKLYAECEHSDPFTLARCITHIRIGLCGACEAPDMPWRAGDKTVKLGPDTGSAGHYEAQRDNGFWRNVARL